MKESTHNYSDAKLNPYHLEDSVWTHTLLALNIAEQMNMPADTKIAVLLHDLGKCYVRKATEETCKVSFNNHASVSFFRAMDVLTKFAQETGMDNQSRRDILYVIANHGLLFEHKLDVNGDVYREKVKTMLLYTYDLLNMALCDSLGRFSISDQANKLDYKTYKDLTDNFNNDYDKMNLHLVHKPKLIMMMGLPASGKSTVVLKKYTNRDYHTLSRDSLVMEMAGTRDYNLAWSTVDHKAVDVELGKRFQSMVKCGYNIVIDMTNMSKKKRNSFLSQASDYQKEAVLVTCDLDEIYKRLMKRLETEGKGIPKGVIESMMASFSFPFFDQFDYIDWIDTTTAIQPKSQLILTK